MLVIIFKVINCPKKIVCIAPDLISRLPTLASLYFVSNTMLFVF